MKKLFIFLFLTSFAASAQTGVKLLARVEQKQVVLRIMPLDAKTWQTGNQQGWVIKKKPISKKGVLINATEKTLGTGNFKPASNADFKAIANNKYAEVARKIIYENPTQDPEEIDFSFALAMLMSSTSQEVSMPMGLLFNDTVVDHETIYEYSVQLADGSVADKITVNAAEYTTLLRPIDIQTAFQDSVATFRWQSGDSLLHVAYKVEISIDQKKWTTLNENPILSTTEPDSLGREYISFQHKIPKFYTNYFFRVRAFTPFGIFSNPTFVQKVVGYRQRFPQIETKIIPQKISIDYVWVLPDSLNPQFKGFKVQTSRFVDSAYATLATLPPSARTYSDKNGANDTYVRIGLIDWEGHELFSEPELVSYDDSIPPLQPIVLVKRVDTAGVVTISWKKNTERDMAGYSVFRADQPTAEFSLMTKSILRDTVFTDTLALNLLNKKQFYVVRAFDTRMNGSLPASKADTIIIKRPDRIPPAAMAIKSFVVADTFVHLQWVNSASDDVALVQLLRKPVQDSVYCVLGLYLKDSLPTLPVAFDDTSGTEKVEYHYALQAIDDAGLSSELAVIQLAKLYTGVRTAIDGLTFVADPKTKSVKISWPLPTRKVQKYVLYRQGPDDDYMATYQHFDGKFGTFTDTNLKPGVAYAYKLQAIFIDDSESRMPVDEAVFVLEN